MVLTLIIVYLSGAASTGGYISNYEICGFSYCPEQQIQRPTVDQITRCRKDGFNYIDVFGYAAVEPAATEKYGYYQYESQEFKTRIFRDIDASGCAKICTASRDKYYKRVHCESLNYHPGWKKCTINSFKAYPAGQGILVRNESVIYAEKYCAPQFPSCIDHSPLCAHWAYCGECRRNIDFMAYICQLSCKVCDKWPNKLATKEEPFTLPTTTETVTTPNVQTNPCPRNHRTSFFIVLLHESMIPPDFPDASTVIVNVDVHQCATYCHQNEGPGNVKLNCLSYNYYPLSANCTIHSFKVAPSGPGTLRKSDLSVYVEKYCLPQQATCVQDDLFFLMYRDVSLVMPHFAVKKATHSSDCSDICVLDSKCQTVTPTPTTMGPTRTQLTPTPLQMATPTPLTTTPTPQMCDTYATDADTYTTNADKYTSAYSYTSDTDTYTTTTDANTYTTTDDDIYTARANTYVTDATLTPAKLTPTPMPHLPAPDTTPIYAADVTPTLPLLTSTPPTGTCDVDDSISSVLMCEYACGRGVSTTTLTPTPSTPAIPHQMLVDTFATITNTNTAYADISTGVAYTGTCTQKHKNNYDNNQEINRGSLNIHIFILKSGAYKIDQNKCYLYDRHLGTDIEEQKNETGSIFIENACATDEQYCFTGNVPAYLSYYGKQVKFPNPDVTITLENLSEKRCTQYCSINKRPDTNRKGIQAVLCASFNYYSLSRICEINLYKANDPKTQGILNKNHSSIYYEKSCLPPKAPKKCAETVTSSYPAYEMERIKGFQIVRIKVKDLRDCLNVCIKRPKNECKSIVYNSNEKVCDLKSSSARDNRSAQQAAPQGYIYVENWCSYL